MNKYIASAGNVHLHSFSLSLSLRVYYYYYYYYYYYLLQLIFHSVAVVLTLVTNKYNLHKRNSTKT
jgi:hypothetical protein